MTLETILSYWILFLVIIGLLEYLEGREKFLERAKRSWPTNLALIAIASGLSALVPVTGYASASIAQQGGYGLFAMLSVSGFALFIISFVALSFWDYLVHLASHKIPFLWRFHKIHHSDQNLDVTTTYRVHPVMHVVLTCSNASMIFVLGLDPLAVVSHALIVLVIDVSHHTTLRLPERLDKILRPYIMTPSLHHIHHSDYVVETDSNYGHDIAFWDRLFGTYQAEPKRNADNFKYGLKQYPQERADDLHALLAAPLKKDPYA